MYKYLVKSVDHRKNYLVLTLSPKNLGEIVEFTAGQYATIGFKSNGRPTPMRCFSFVGSPRDNDLQFAMRPNGRFTSKVAQLEVGHQVNLQGPFGHFVIEEVGDKSIIMLAAGIGITPFMSMLRWVAADKISKPITLIYSNHDKRHIPFQQELNKLQAKNPNLRVVYLVSEGEQDEANKIFVGHLDIKLVKKLSGKGFQNSTFLICGPPRYMDKIADELHADKISEEQIILESFEQKSTFGWKLSSLGIQAKTYLAVSLILALMAGLIGLLAGGSSNQSFDSSWELYIIRAAGFVAAGLVLGLMISGIGQVTGLTYRLVEPVKAWAIHKAMAISLLAVIAVHVSLIVINGAMAFSIADATVPLMTKYSNGTSVLGLDLSALAVTFGILAMYGVIIIVASSLGWIDTRQKLWRWLHYLGYLVVFDIFFHGLYVGTDLIHGFVRLLWVSLAGILLIMIISRLMRAGTLRFKKH